MNTRSFRGANLKLENTGAIIKITIPSIMLVASCFFAAWVTLSSAQDWPQFRGPNRDAKAVKIEKQGDTFVPKELWSTPENSVQFNTPVLKDGLLFGLSAKGSFFCINAESGKTAWVESAGGRGGYGSIVDGGSVLLALTPKSQLIVFQPSDKEYTEVTSIKVADNQTYSYPVVAGKRLFIKDQDSVILWTLD